MELDFLKVRLTCLVIRSSWMDEIKVRMEGAHFFEF